MSQNNTPQLFILPETAHHQDWLTNWALDQGNSQSQIITLNTERGEQSLLSVELVRELIGAASLQARRQQPLTYLLLHLEKASSESQNALLKILEEPPAGLHLLLSSTDLSTVLPTITSRCYTHLQPLSLSISSELPPEFQPFAFPFWNQHSYGEIINLIDLTLTTQANLQKSTIAAAEEETKSSLERRIARALLLHLIAHYESHLPQPTALTALQLLTLAATQLQANVNPRLVLENLFFTLKKS